MKLKIHKKSKKRFILLLLILIVFFSLKLAYPLLSPQTVLKDTVQYEAACQPNVAYQVVINPNEVYSGTIQKENEFYSKKLFHHIQAEFDINYTGSKKVPMDIEYQLLATVNGFQGKEESKQIYWSKVFPITAKKSLKEGNSDTWIHKETLNIPLSIYDSFAVRAEDITGMNLASELNVSMKGRIIAHTGKEDLETPFETSIQIPLMEDVFKITKLGIDPIKDQVTAKVKTAKPADPFQTIPYAFFLFLCIAGLIVLLFFTKEPSREELQLKKVSGTIKNYGSRIAALQSTPTINCRERYQVHSMKDLIKIADELQRPIFYVADSSTIARNHEFLLIDQETIYSLSFDSSDV